MAQCKLSSQEFIKNAFTPQVAVLCSNTVDDICQKNKLSFIELVQPFSKLNGDVCLQDANGGVIICRNLRVNLVDVNFRPPQPTLARKFLNASVSQYFETRHQSMHVGDYNLEVPTFTPWFDSWRELFLQVQFPSDHEFTKHFLGCMLIVSSSDLNPIESMTALSQTLTQLENVAPCKLPKWFTGHVFRFYVVLHDNADGNMDKATQTYEAFKVSFGINNCFLLRTNSRPPGQPDEQLPDPWSQYINQNFDHSLSERSTPDISPSISRSFTQEAGQEFTDSRNTLPYHPLSPDTEVQKLPEFILEIQQPHYVSHGQYLTTDDVEQVKLLIHEFCTRGLLPYIEKLIQSLTDVVSNKKGVSKSLFSATKRWFTPNKTGPGNGGSATLPIYTLDAPELQIRKLGDLYFMLGHYNMAFQIYHAAKRDFNADQAWFYYAGALEMASLAAFMANESNRKTYDYMEEAIVTYLNVCGLAQFATRATLLSSECLKGKNLQGEAAHQLIRMTSEESDLRSALLLEQAAYCFLTCSRPQMVRKYSFHMVLAGHRFSKASQKRHALRCYKQALQVYQKRGWTFAEDHVHYTIGKLSSSLNILEEAALSFSNLLTVQSKQTVEQQTAFLKEYLTMEKLLLARKEEPYPAKLSLPLLEFEHTKILVGPTPPLSIPGKVRALGISFNSCDDTQTAQKWIKLEEMIVQEAQGVLPLTFKPVVTLYSRENIGYVKLTGIVNEPIQVALKLYNPLSVTLNLKGMHLLWDFKSTTGDVASNENMNNSKKFVRTQILKSVTIQTNNSQEVVLVVTPLVVGTLFLKGIFYDLLSCDNPTDAVVVEGKQMFDFENSKLVKDSSNNKLAISVMPPAPCLQISFGEISTEMLCDEIQQITMEMRNEGNGPLHKVYICTSVPQLISTSEFNEKIWNFRNFENMDTPAIREKEARKNHVTYVPLPNDRLDVGQSLPILMWLKAPNFKGTVTVDLLIYYENYDSTSVPRYRLIRHVWNLTVHDSLKLNLAVTEGCKTEQKKQVLFSFKAVNLNKLHYSTLTEISLNSTGLLSNMWSLKLSQNVKLNQSFKISSQQSAYLLLKGLRHLTKSLRYHEVRLTPTGNRYIQKPNNVYVDFAKRRQQNRINVFDDPATIKMLQEKEGVIYFHWSAIATDSSGKKRYCKGQTDVRIERFKNEDEEDYLYEPPASTQGSDNSCRQEIGDELKLELYVQITPCILNISKIYHNFKKRKLCTIPLKLSLHNDSPVSSIITINTSKTKSIPAHSLRPNLFQPIPSKEYQWVGLSGTKKTVGGYSTEMVTMYVAVTSPGVYDLSSRLEFWCQNEFHHKPVLQIIKPQCFLTVQSVH